MIQVQISIAKKQLRGNMHTFHRNQPQSQLWRHIFHMNPGTHKSIASKTLFNFQVSFF